MTSTHALTHALTAAFKQITVGMNALGESARRAALALDKLHRIMVLYIRRRYVLAGKPYGNGYARMMRWWREQAEYTRAEAEGH